MTVTTPVVALVWVKHCPAVSYSPFLTAVAAWGLAEDGDPQGMEKTQPPLICVGLQKSLCQTKETFWGVPIQPLHCLTQEGLSWCFQKHPGGVQGVRKASPMPWVIPAMARLGTILCPMSVCGSSW